MKTFYLTAMAVITGMVTSFAQPTLTDINTNPQIGDMEILNIISYTSPGSSGANQNWNFSSITANSVDTQFVGNPSSSSYGSSFPTATYYMYSNSSTDEGFYKATSSVQQVVGLYSAGTGTSSYTDPQDALRFPFQYQNSFADSFSTSFTSGATIYRNGEVVVTADGYGAITLPYGTLNGVLRVKTVQDYADSSSFSVTVGKTTSYHWYKPGVRYPVMMLSTLQYGGSTTQYGWFLDQSVVGINNNHHSNEMDLVIAPNPAQDVLNINMNIKSSSNVAVTILDATGKIVIKEDLGRLAGGSSTNSIDIKGLRNGLYVLTVKTESGLIQQRFIKR